MFLHISAAKTEASLKETESFPGNNKHLQDCREKKAQGLGI